MHPNLPLNVQSTAAKKQTCFLRQTRHCVPGPSLPWSITAFTSCTCVPAGRKPNATTVHVSCTSLQVPPGKPAIPRCFPPMPRQIPTTRSTLLSQQKCLQKDTRSRALQLHPCTQITQRTPKIWATNSHSSTSSKEQTTLLEIARGVTAGKRGQVCTRYSCLHKHH